MFAVLDGWDQVPFRSTSLGDLTSTLPKLKKEQRLQIFLLRIKCRYCSLPAGNGIGRASKNAAKALLMKIYLNKGVYANRATPTFAAADMNQVITLADQILADYPHIWRIYDNFFDDFTPNNDVIVKK